jgi:hypothetical protein
MRELNEKQTTALFKKAMSGVTGGIFTNCAMKRGGTVFVTDLCTILSFPAAVLPAAVEDGDYNQDQVKALLHGMTCPPQRSMEDAVELVGHLSDDVDPQCETGQAFWEAVRDASVMASLDETRYVLMTAVYNIDDKAVVATDGRRLCRAVLPEGEAPRIREGLPEGCELRDIQHLSSPGKLWDVWVGASCLAEGGTMAMYNRTMTTTRPGGREAAVEDEVGDKVKTIMAQYSIETVHGTVYCRTQPTDGTYPTYEQVIPFIHSEWIDVKVDAAAVKAYAALGKKHCPVLRMHDGRSTMCMQNDSEFPCKDLGEAKEGMSFMLDALFLLDSIAFTGTDTFKYLDSMTPAVFRKGDRLAVQMPIRMD